MARPIREIPILFGEEGKRFEEKMRNASRKYRNQTFA